MGFTFNQHPEMEGLHSFRAPSNPSWRNYDDEKLIDRYINSKAQQIGTILHAYAQWRIGTHRKMRKIDISAVEDDLCRNEINLNLVDLDRIYPCLSEYINDCIKLGMSTEVGLGDVKTIFGHADAISFEKNLLRVSDLKTGETMPHMEQLYTYNALFCIEYKVKPESIKFIDSIYHIDGAIIDEPDPSIIREFMDIIEHQNRVIADFEKEVLGYV